MKLFSRRAQTDRKKHLIPLRIKRASAYWVEMYTLCLDRLLSECEADAPRLGIDPVAINTLAAQLANEALSQFEHRWPELSPPPSQ